MLSEKFKALKNKGILEILKNRKRRFFQYKAFTFFEKFGLHVLPVHYYNPVPDTRQLKKNFNRWYKKRDMAGIDMNLAGNIDLLNQLTMYKNELGSIPSYEDVSSSGYGQGYGPIEAQLLYLFCRYAKPKKVIEVGSGVSSVFTMKALDKNFEEEGVISKFTAIEPYPMYNLSSIKGNCQFELIPKLVQDVEMAAFEDLDRGDILFIDSSHISAYDSDVDYLFLDVLPNLKSGVYIHIHDILFPYPAPEPEHWVFKKHLFFNEAALLQAFLAFNNHFKIILCESNLHFERPDILKNALEDYDPSVHYPSSIWLQKIQ